MLQFKEIEKNLHGIRRFESTNACNGTVKIYKFLNGKINVVIEYFGKNPKDFETYRFKAKKFYDFETAKNWAETQICQIVKLKIKKIKN